MKCKFHNKDILIADYLAGNLEEPELTEIETHLLECKECFAQAKILEKVTFLVQTEGPKAFTTDVPKSFSDKIKEFLKNLRPVPKLQFGLASLATIVVLGIFTFIRYNSEMHSTFTFASSDSFFRGLRAATSQKVDDNQKLMYHFTVGQTAFQNEYYTEALSSFNLTQSLCRQADGITTADSVLWQYRIQLYLGATKVMLWKSQKPGYFKWLEMKIRSEQIDMTLLNEAEKNLLNAQSLAHKVKEKPEGNESLNTLLTKIRERTSSQ